MAALIWLLCVASVLFICILWAIFGHRVENFLDHVEDEVHLIDEFLSEVKTFRHTDDD